MIARWPKLALLLVWTAMAGGAGCCCLEEERCADGCCPGPRLMWPDELLGGCPSCQAAPCQGGLADRGYAGGSHVVSDPPPLVSRFHPVPIKPVFGPSTEQAAPATYEEAVEPAPSVAPDLSPPAKTSPAPTTPLFEEIPAPPANSAPADSAPADSGPPDAAAPKSAFRRSTSRLVRVSAAAPATAHR